MTTNFIPFPESEIVEGLEIETKTDAEITTNKKIPSTVDVMLLGDSLTEGQSSAGLHPYELAATSELAKLCTTNFQFTNLGIIRLE